ncbi:single-stranded DNA-binding protein [Brachymonas denitrificans]|uniref:single-stranded DNA-binding protein n=1 Tax=Brachymonas denitrificans TaxID=28220 RepID=UPI001BCD8FFC|nr:single-stranded DNA-binding protein [Brachymonas denitrificans]
MIDGLIAGKVYGQPQSRTDSHGKQYALGKVKAAAGNGEVLFVSCIVFGDAARQFLVLGDGDAVALAGSISPKAWTDKDGQARPALDMQVQQVLTAYHGRKKRQQMQDAENQQFD